MTQWTALQDKAKLQDGGKYRSTYYIKLPYSDGLADTIRQAIHGAAGVLHVAGVSVIGVGIKKPEETVQTPGGRYTRWAILVEWYWRKA